MRRWLAAVGVVAVLLGGVGLALENLLADPIPAVDPEVLAVVAGFVTLVATLFAVVGRSVDDTERAAPPDREHGIRAPVPGAECAPSSENPTATLAFRRRLSERVVDALVSERGFAPEAAREAVDDGSWTDDRVAAALLSDGDFDPPLGTRLRWWVRGIDAERRAGERALDALGRLRGERV